MAQSTRHDAWQAGDSYEAYMGRWSRRIAPIFLDWLGAAGDRDWLEVGCGTGALSACILERCAPRSLIGIEPSAGFLAKARADLPDARAHFLVGDAGALPVPDASRDLAVSALVLNFVPDRVAALTEMQRVLRPGGTIAFYVWDYPGGGMGLMRAFWNAAAALDPAAADLTEDKRFPFCTPEGLIALAAEAGLGPPQIEMIEVPTVFTEFDDYWRPFTLGTGPAPGYCKSLAPEARERLKQRLHDSLPRQADGSIALTARAWAVKVTVTSLP